MHRACIVFSCLSTIPNLSRRTTLQYNPYDVDVHPFLVFTSARGHKDALCVGTNKFMMIPYAFTVGLVIPCQYSQVTWFGLKW